MTSQSEIKCEKRCILHLVWEPSVEKALNSGKLTPEQKSSLNRQLCMSIIAQSNGTVTANQRNEIALKLVQKYPCLRGSIGSGHVS